MPKAISHIANLVLSLGILVGGPYSMQPWEEDEKFKAMIAGRHNKLFHQVRNGVSWRRLVHTMFEEDTNGQTNV